MKKYNNFRALATVMLLSAFLISTAVANAQGGGNGTSSNPYLISTTQHLRDLKSYVENGNTQYVNDNIYWKLTANITWNNGSGTANRIGYKDHPFRGHFDGDGYTITMTSIDAGMSGEYVGFFGQTYNAEIKNLFLNGTYIHGASYIGWLIGEAKGNTTLENVHVSMSTSSSSIIYGHYWGGLIGHTWDIEGKTINIKGCSAIGRVALYKSSGDHDVGGLIGAMRKYTQKTGATFNISDCLVDVYFALGSGASGSSIGGVIGWTEFYNKVYLTRIVTKSYIPNHSNAKTKKNGVYIAIIGAGSEVYYTQLINTRYPSWEAFAKIDGSYYGNKTWYYNNQWANNDYLYNKLERISDTGGTKSSNERGNEWWGYNDNDGPKVRKNSYAVVVRKGSGINTITGSRYFNGSTGYLINSDETLTVSPSPTPTSYQRVQYTFTPDYNHSSGAANNYTATMNINNWRLIPRVNGVVSAKVLNVPYPKSPTSTFDQWSRKVTLNWGYDNPDNLAGRFFIYQQERGATEWTVLNPSGITVINGNGRTASYTHENVELNKQLDYIIAFVETTTGSAPTSPYEIDQWHRAYVFVNTAFTLGTWTATARGEASQIVVSFTADTRLSGSNFTYAIHRNDNNTGYPSNARWEGNLSGQATYTFNDGEVGDNCNVYQYRVTLTAYADIYTKYTADARTTSILKFAATDPFKASKGEFTNYVRLQWNMDKAAGGEPETYRVFRRVANQFDNPNDGWTQLETITSSDATIYWNDMNALTGIYYEYKVSSYQICTGSETELESRTDIGFTQAFGSVLGRISFGTGNAVQNVNVLAVPSNNEDNNKQFSLRSKGATNKYFEWMSTQAYFNPIWMSQNWTLQFWINPDGTNTETSGSSDNSLIGYIGNDALHMTATTGGYQIVYHWGQGYFRTDAIIPANHFTHVTIVRNGTTVTIYTVHDNDPNNIEIKHTLRTGMPTSTNVLAVTSHIRLGQSLWGHLDDVRFWSRSLPEEEIAQDYSRRLVGNEEGLIGYWNFDDGLEGYAFDMSRNGTVFNGNHATTNTLVFNEQVPNETYQLSFKGITNESGNYQISGIPFTGEGTLYSIVPSMGVHQFNPNEQFRYISPTSMVHNATDFTDISSFPVSGRVIYEGGTYPVGGCSFEIDYRPVLQPNGQPITTDHEGHFTISVPIGIHTVRVVKQGHTFANDGFLKGADGEDLNYIGELNNIEFHDQTRVKLIGRVVGGMTEDAKPLGFGESINNIGVQTVLLETTRPNYSFTDTPYSETFLHNQGQWQKPDGLGDDQTTVNYNPHDVTLHVSPVTGEFVAWIYPEPYNIRNITVPRAGGIQYTVYNNNEMLDLSSAAVPDDSYMQFNLRTWNDSIYIEPFENMEGHWESVTLTDTVKYHATWQYYYATTPTFSVVQMVDKEPVAYFGEKTYTIENMINDEKEELELYNETTGEYFFDIPVFQQGEVYSFLLSGYEEYTNWVIDPDEPVTIHYPVKEGRVNMSNEIDLDETALTFPMNANGEFLYQFMGGPPNLTTGQNSFYATLTLGAASYYWDMGQQPIVAWHLGNRSTGTDYLTEGPDKVSYILRDPPGNRSKAFLDIGSSHSERTFSEMSHAGQIAEYLTLSLGTKTTTFTGVGAGVVINFQAKNDWTSGFSLTETWSSKTETTVKNTTTERFETSADPHFVGSQGDVFIGYSTNLLYGLTNGISIMMDNEVGAGQTFTSHDNYSIASSNSMAYGQTFNTKFVYTQRDIEDVMIPKWKSGIETMLLPMGTNVNLDVIENPVYVSNLPHDHVNFGKVNTDPVFGENASPPSNVHDGPSYNTLFPNGYDFREYVLDSIMYFNNQIDGWIAQLRRNEEEKVKMQYKDNFSFGSGVTVQYSHVHDSIHSKTESLTSFLNLTVLMSDVGFTLNSSGLTWKNDIHYMFTDVGGETDTDQITINTGFVLQADGTSDQVTVDYGFSPSGTFAFRTRGGRTSCPHEPEDRTKYFEPGQHILNEGTMQIEVPKIRIASSPHLINVPANKEALFTLALENESETGEDRIYQLAVVENTNPHGATLMVDGGAIGPGRNFICRHGETLFKTLAVGKGAVDNYENIGIFLRSPCQSDPTMYHTIIADIAYFSVDFIPAVSDVEILEPYQNWILNSGHPTSDTLMVAIGNFDINFPNFGYIRLQYRPVTSPDWNTIMTFYPSHLYENAQGLKEDIGTRPVIYYPWKTPSIDGQYELRAMITSVNSVDGIIIGDPLSFYYTDAISGWRDVSPPQPLGLPSPANGILGIGDELSITFNKEIQTGMLTENNFNISGILNAQEIAEPNVGLSFTGGAQFANTELPIFTNGSFAIETWFKTDLNENGTALKNEGTLFAFGTHDNFISLGFNANGNAVLQIANEGPYVSEIAIAKDETWKYIALCYNRDNNTVSVFQFEGATDNYLFIEQPLFFAPETQGRLFVGNNQNLDNGFSGAIAQMCFYGVNRLFTDVTAQKSITKMGNEFGLIGYWMMDEAEGNIARDKARQRHLILQNDWYVYPSGYAIHTSGNNYFSVPLGNSGLGAFRDVTAEFWFRSESNDFTEGSTLLCTEIMYVSVNETGGLSLYLNDGTLVQTITTNNLMNSQWHHVAFTVRRGTSDFVHFNIYINGENAASFTATIANAFSSGYFYFGTKRIEYNSFDNYFAGYYDEIRVWNAALSRENIILNKNSKLHGDEHGLKAYYPFEIYTKLPNGLIVVTSTTKNMLNDNEISGTATLSTVAVPVKDVRPVEDVPFTFVASDTKITFTLPNSYFARVEGTTLNITVKDVLDMHNNLSNAEHWTAFVKRNPLKWDSDPIYKSMEVGDNLTFTARITNTGGSNISYSFENMPSWLSVSQETGNLLPMSYRDLVFTVFQGINIGHYETGLRITSGNGIFETLPVQLKVTGQRPDWHVNPNDFESTMNITGQIKVENIYQEDPDDILGAFIGDLCVGVTSPTYINPISVYYVFSTVSGNQELNNQPLTFKLWRAATGRIYPVVQTSVEDIVYSPTTILGSIANPVIFNALDVVEQTIELREGWTWISTNVLSDDPPILDQITTSLGTTGDIIKGREAYLQQPDWLGTLTSISETTMYSIKTHSDHSLVLTGKFASPAATPITINHGWNWIGYIPSFTLPIQSALAGLNAQLDDMIKGQTGYALYAGNAGWVGNLTFLQAGSGYKLYSGNETPQTLIYPSSAPQGAPVESPKNDPIEPRWSVEINQFSTTMTVTAIVVKDDIEERSDYIEIGAFSGDECRGTAFLRYIESLDRYIGFLMIYGHGSEPISLKVYDHATDIEADANNNPFIFAADLMYGNPSVPYIVGLGTTEVGIDENSLAGVTVYPNPTTGIFTVSGLKFEVSGLDIFDVAGRLVHRKPLTENLGTVVIDISYLQNGVYFLKIGSEMVRIVKK